MNTPTTWLRHRVVDRVRSFWKLEWIGEDDLYLQAVSEITPHLFVGRMPSLDSVNQLHERGITHVVSCLQEKKRSEVGHLEADFDHLFLPADDQMQQQMGETFARFFAHIDERRGNPSEPTFLVHCEVGVSRSASLAIALLMRDQGLSLIDGYERVRSKRIQVLPNIAFASQLQHLEHQLQPERSGVRPSSLATYLTRYCNAPCDVDDLQEALERNGFDAPAALRSIYGGEIPRVVQGVRSTGR